MPATITPLSPKRTSPPARPPTESPRRPFRDNPRLILAGILLLVALLAAILGVANRTPRLSPDFLSEFVLYALSAADFTILVVFVWLLARNIVKLVVERRRGLPFARFRSKLVALLLAMTLVPAVLVLIVGSELIRTSVDRWFNAPMDEILSSANQIAGDFYYERQMLASDHAARIARALSAIDLATTDATPVRNVLAPEVTRERVQMVAVYRVRSSGRGQPQLEPVVDLTASPLPRG